MDRLTLSTLALSGHLADRLEPTALIDVSGTDVNVVATAEGRLVFNRAAVLSGAQASIPNRFEAEVIRSFAAYQREHRARVLARILVSGAGAPGLDLTSAAGLVAAAVEVPTGGLKDSVYDTSVAGIGPHAIALGAARQELSGPIAPINLIPEERLLRRATAARKRRQNLVALAAAAIVLIALVGVQRIMAYRADNDRRTQQANADYLAVQSRLDAARPAHDELVADHTALMAGLDPTRPVVDVMEAVSANLPQGGTLWLTQFDFARGGVITLRGETRSESAVTDLVLNLLHCGKFSDVHLTFLGDAETTSTNTAAGPATTADVKMPPLPGFSTPPAQSSATPPAAQPAAPAKAAPAPAPAGPAPSQTRGPAAASPSRGFGSFQFDPSRLSTLPPDVQQRIRDRLRQGGGAAGTAAGGPPPPPPPPPAAAITKVATRGPSVQPADRRVVTTGGARLTLARAPSPSHTLRAAPRARSHTLETFIITLRVNPRASSLVISPSDRLTAHLTSASPGAARHAAAPIDTGSGDFTEGGDDAGQ